MHSFITALVLVAGLASMPNALPTVEIRQTEIITQIIANFGCLTVAGAKVLGNCSSSASGRSLLDLQPLPGQNDLAVSDRSTMNLTSLINTLVKNYGCPAVNIAYNLCVTFDPVNPVTQLIKTFGCATVLFTATLSNCPTSRNTAELTVDTDMAEYRSTNIIQTYGCPAFTFAQKVCTIINPATQNAVLNILSTIGCYGVNAVVSLGQCSTNSTSSPTIGTLIKTYGCPPFEVAYKMCQQYNNGTSSG